MEELTEAYVLNEIRKLQFFYGLKKEIRFGEKRTDELDFESVAEHVYGMFVMFEYFHPLEDTKCEWDVQKMKQMILFHDVDEVITGDKIGYEKTKEDREKESAAFEQVIESIPASMQQDVKDILLEYEKRETIESKFVKAIDKIEPTVHLLNDDGREQLHRINTTYKQNESIKLPYFHDFPTIKGFYLHAAAYMQRNGFFVEE